MVIEVAPAPSFLVMAESFLRAQPVSVKLGQSQDFLGGYKLKAAQGDRYAVLDLSRVWMLSIGLEYAWGDREQKR